MVEDITAVSESSAKELQILAEAIRPPLPTNHLVATKKAIDILQRDFEDLLEIEDMVLAFEVMENTTHAAMFLCMSGQAREAWLKRLGKKRGLPLNDLAQN